MSTIMSILKKFADLGISAEVLRALIEIGYENPFPVQEESIPIMLQGQDLLVQAQTGTGKTAAFALPILSKLVVEQKSPQALILTPTRELALQVAEAFRSYAKHVKGFHILPIYGGQNYETQFKALKRGVHVIVGTPGRLMDHLRRGTLVLDAVKTIILDEADEMLKMGFIEDVSWILQQMPKQRQMALFSATIPPAIQKIANQYLREAQDIRINPEAKTVEEISQFCMVVANNHKLEAITRFLEVESFDAVLIFTRTKTGSTELAEKLEARGYAVAAVNGDMKQSLRERVIKQIKNKTIDIVVGTDIAARGLDIDRVTHVISYDIPFDTTSYVHRIGRTGRAGREGKALLLVEPREVYTLRAIERAINQPIAMIMPPSIGQVHAKRAASFMREILQVLETKDLDNYRELVENAVKESECSELDVAAALAFLVQKEKPLQPMQDDKDFMRALSEAQQNSVENRQRKKKKRQRFGKSRGEQKTQRAVESDRARGQAQPSKRDTSKKHKKKSKKERKGL